MIRIIIILALLISGCNPVISDDAPSDLCLLTPKTGHCRAAITKYYFHKSTGSCQQFVWGGCGGVVPFDTKTECTELCVNSDYQASLDNSLIRWQQSKNKYGNSYQYSTGFSSWVGFGNETTISVKADRVIKRVYRAWNAEGSEVRQWSEDSADILGTNNEGAALKTIEERYQDCRTLLLKHDNEKNNIYLAFDDTGILKHCLYAPKNCADDCSSGVRIKNISFQH